MKYDEIRVKEGLCLRLKRFFSVKLKDKNFLKGISTLCGASLLNLIAGSVFSVCQLMIYEISYIYHSNPEDEISSDNETFYYPVELLSQTIATFFSAFLDKRFGLHITNLIGMIVLIIGYFILLFSKSFAADMVSMVFSGIGTGIISYPSTANACEWFKDNNGFVVGIIETMISLGSFSYNLMGEKITNPDHRKSVKTKDADDKLYEADIADRFKTYIIWLIVSVILLYGLSFALTFKKTKELFRDTSNVTVGLLAMENENEFENQNPNEQNQEHFNEKQLGLISNTVEHEKVKKDFKKMLFAAIKSKALILFILIVILESPLSSMIFSLNRSIGELKGINQYFLSSLGPVNFIFECVGGLIIGILCDFVSKRNLLLFNFGSSSIIAIFYCLTFSSDLWFFIFTNLASFISGGFYSFKDYYLINIFGVDLYVELMACVNLLASFVIIALTPLSYSLQNNSNIESNAPYWILFSICGILCLLGLVLSLYAIEDPLNYDDLIKDDDDDKEENKNA